MKKKFRFTAFTLAEVLIVLGIIGIVAEMTIPNLIQDSQKQVYATSLKKAYTNFNQVLLQISADKGCSYDLKCTGLFATNTDSKSLGDELVRYFKVIKNCGIATGQGCFAANTNANYDGSSTTNYQWDNDDTRYKFITTDGMAFAVKNYANGNAADCGNAWSPATGGLGYMSQTCGIIIVDVNGSKGPNNRGRDTFIFFITNGKGAILYPQGGIDDNFSGTYYWWNDNNDNKCSSSGTSKYGVYCPGRVMENGWVMDY